MMAKDDPLYTPEKAILVQGFPQGLDPRIYAVTPFAATQPGAPPVWATACTWAKIEAENVSFSIPSPAALFLYAAQRAFFRLKDIDLSKVVKRTSSGPTVDEDLRILYDAFEHLFTNVIFSYSAIEAYANLLIPDSYTLKATRRDNKCTETYTKDQIERHVSLDIKLSQVLPEIAGTTLSKGTSLWHEYATLRDLRDRLIHAKSVDVGVREKGIDTIWSLLLKRKNMDASITAFKVMKCFPQKKENHSPVSAGRNEWLTAYPFFRDPKTSK